jgi:hypothetical protein
MAQGFKELTFYSVAGNKYRCNQVTTQNTRPMTQKQMIGFINGYLESGRGPVLKIGQGKAPAKPSKGSGHPSKYRQKNRR